jgi:formamidopyrimidine-DNA glycosylase
MPELPEVENIKIQLDKINQFSITKIYRSEFKLRLKNHIDFNKIINLKITKISRRAKYLLLKIENNFTLIFHLGMSGRINLSKDFESKKHDHFACLLSNNEWLIYNDPRRFGFVDLVKSSDIEKYKMLSNLGLEPLDANFNFEYFFQNISNKTTNIKKIIMDNNVVVGVGNIYASESLFDAKISPLRTGNSITIDEAKRIVNSIKKIIKSAIDMGGSSISDYQNIYGLLGNFQNYHMVYGKDLINCQICATPITRIVQNQRSSFYCNKCQL